MKDNKSTLITYEEYQRRRQAWRATPAKAHNPSNPSNECRQCGRPLEPEFGYCEVSGVPDWPLSGNKSMTDFANLRGFGYHSNNFFCTQRCGYQFGYRALSNALKEVAK